MAYITDSNITRILNMAVSATETMNSLEIDCDIIKARLKIIREIADGLGVDVKIPSNKAIMIKRFITEATR
jgi:hypothetical protein